MSGWTETRIETLRNMWGKHKAEVIAEAIGMTRNAVIGKANRLQLGSLRPHRSIKADPKAVAEKYLSGLHAWEIADEVGCSESGLWRFLVRNGVPTRSHKEAALNLWARRRSTGTE